MHSSTKCARTILSTVNDVMTCVAPRRFECACRATDMLPGCPRWTIQVTSPVTMRPLNGAGQASSQTRGGRPEGRALSASLCDCDAFEVLESALRISHLRFHVYHENGKICAHRTDHEDPWGLHLARVPAWPSMAQHGPAWRPWELLSCSRRVADVALRSCTVTTRTGYDRVLILRAMRDAVFCNERLTAYCEAPNGHKSFDRGL